MHHYVYLRLEDQNYRKGYIIHAVKYPVNKYVNTMQCFKCQRFGHMASQCK